MKGRKFSPQKKDRRKVIRSIVEGVVLLAILIFIIRALLPSRGYLPISEDSNLQTEQGFIAVSYFGVDRTGDKTLISTKRLNEHLEALTASGYVTISQQDIIDYYTEGKALPEKALFLIFEDGRRDTGIFAQKIMEKYNMKATMLTYAQNLTLEDAKFLRPKDLKELVKSTFWELGTNGYRLSYINVFDRHDNFLNQLNTYKFQMVSGYLDRNYNHYLMDYIRDASGIPMETYSQMQERIAWDYNSIEDIYEKEMDKVPGMYILMHSNTGQFGTNDKVSAENFKWMQQLFQMNFNREGDSLNTSQASLYDLTRMQPQSYWYTNHLLMRIQDDTGQQVVFVTGDEDRKSDWNTIKGQPEFIKDTIALTSLPGESGLMKLKDTITESNIQISAELGGNKAGTQTIYVRADDDLEEYLAFSIENTIFYVYEKQKSSEKKILFSLNLDVHDGIKLQSLEENKLEAEIKELETELKYVGDLELAKKINEQLKEKESRRAASVNEGAEEYIPEIGISEAGKRFLKVMLENDEISVIIDDKAVTEHLKVSITEGEGVYLEAAPIKEGYSQRNLADDVYDGVFKNLVISKYSTEKKEDIIYDNRLSGFEKAADTVKKGWDSLINWFIKYL
jgi:peptidoglycan/xylan/chitin deacetylase (PgdA/CDA1 family)